MLRRWVYNFLQNLIHFFLCTGTTEASFHSFGIIPVAKDILNIIVNGFAKVDAQFF